VLRAADADHRRALLHGTVGNGRQMEPVPVHDVVDVGVVDDVDRDVAPIAHAQRRAGDAVVVGIGVDHLAGSELEPLLADAQRVIRTRGGLGKGPAARAEGRAGCRGTEEDPATVEP
jgi:hypothetical protein